MDPAEEIIRIRIPALAGIRNFSSKTLRLVCLAYLAAFGLAEYLSHYISAAGGISLYVIILFCLILNAALSENSDQRGFWIALGLAPFIRIASLALPVMLELSILVWYIIVSIPVLAAVVMVMRFLKYSPDDVGLNLANPSVQLLIAPVGFFLGAIGYLSAGSEAWTGALSLETTLYPALVLLVCTGVIEELAFRGVMQKAAGKLGSFGWVYIALVYTVLQIGQNPPAMCLCILAASLFFGYMVKTSGSITGASLAHGLFNIGLYLALPHINIA